MLPAAPCWGHAEQWAAMGWAFSLGSLCHPLCTVPTDTTQCSVHPRSRTASSLTPASLGTEIVAIAAGGPLPRPPPPT